jgi:hypothetical protein
MVTMRQRRVTSIAAFVLLISVLLSIFPTNVAAAFGSYTDLSSHWARSAIEQIYNTGALDDPPPLYRPDTPITRGQFARYLVLGWGLEPYVGTVQFLTDVPPSHAYFKYVNALYARGIMIGSAGVFGVGAALTREQAATVLVRAAGREEGAQIRPVADAEAIVARYIDHDFISRWAIPYLAEAYVAGLFTGDAAGTFRPRAPMSKAEACTVCYRTRNGQPILDFGDAPDWPPLFGFPSLLISDGARHKNWKTVWLGERVDAELDSRQLNADFFDDGFVRFIAGGAAPTMQIQFEVSVASRDAALYGQDPAKSLYFNLLIDWDKDMVWEPDEWVVQNFVIDPNTWPAGSMMETLLSPPFANRGNPYECWYRLTLTKGEKMPPGWVGKGSFIYGETEDYGPEEQKTVVLSELIALVHEWQGSQDQGRMAVAASLGQIIPLVEDLVAEEQADDPVQTLIDKKRRILDQLYKAAEYALAVGLVQGDVDRVFERLWKLMAFVTEEECKRCAIGVLRDTLRQNFGIPADSSKKIQEILDKLADLLYEQERGDPAEVLLRKKDVLIALLQELLAALKAAKQPGPAASAEQVLNLLLFIKALETPQPPQPTPPTWPPPVAPKLPPLITGVHTIFEYSNGQARMKVHLLSNYTLDNKVYDIEIYCGHQASNPPAGSLKAGTGPQGWTAETATVGIRYYGDTPLVPCTSYYFTFSCPCPGDAVVIVLTDKEHRPIGHAVSQKVRTGTFMLAPGESAGLMSKLDPTVPPGLMWDLQYVLQMSHGGQGPVMDPWLLGNIAHGGGIQLLPKGLADLAPGGYLPEGGYLGGAGPVKAGEYYALRDSMGEGYALLYVVSVGPNGCLLDCEYNPGDTMVWGELPLLAR